MCWRPLIAALLIVGGAATAWTQELVQTLVVPTEPVAPGATVRTDVVILNSGIESAEYALPATITGQLTSGEHRWAVQLHAVGGGEGQVEPRAFANVGYTFEVPTDATGRLVLELHQTVVLRGVIDASEPTVAKSPTIVPSPLSHAVAQPASSTVKRTFAGRIAAHEPIYFIYGSQAPGAKFQFSFKYRLLGDNARLGETIPMLRGLYFGYTQRSLWDIEGESSPFYDTSYMPELIVQSESYIDPSSAGSAKWMGYQLAIKHESNGRAGLESRSVNIVYLRTAFAFGRIGGWNLLVAPRVFAYVSDLSNNPDIADYRGYGDLVLVAGSNDGASLAIAGQLGRGAHKGSLQADLSIPVKFDRLFDFATYVLIQYWDGYGEDLLEYNKRSSRLRVGFSLVR